MNIDKDLRFTSFNHTQVGLHKRPIQQDATVSCPLAQQGGGTNDYITLHNFGTVRPIFTKIASNYRVKRWGGWITPPPPPPPPGLFRVNVQKMQFWRIKKNLLIVGGAPPIEINPGYATAPALQLLGMCNWDTCWECGSIHSCIFMHLTRWRLVQSVLGLGSTGNVCYSKIKSSSMN